MKKVAFIFGTRPQFIKLAAVLGGGKKYKFHSIVINTGQHYDYELSDIFYRELDIKAPHYNLQVGSATQAVQTGMMMTRLEPILLRLKPTLVVVFGDTNSTLAAALTAAKNNIPVAHVEAGMRTHILSQPEELNRKVTSHVTTLHFCPTLHAVDNLHAEGIKKNVYNTGDVMAELLLKNMKRINPSSIIKKLQLEHKNYVFMTVHRAQNTNNVHDLKRLITILEKIPFTIVFPLHPRTKHSLVRAGLYRVLQKKSNLHLIPPVGYIDAIWLQKHAFRILTDSGGIQKEAFLLHVPCLTLRTDTEWPETVSLGQNILAGLNVKKVLWGINQWHPRVTHKNPFVHGSASNNIQSILNGFLEQQM